MAVVLTFFNENHMLINITRGCWRADLPLVRVHALFSQLHLFAIGLVSHFQKLYSFPAEAGCISITNTGWMNEMSHLRSDIFMWSLSRSKIAEEKHLCADNYFSMQLCLETLAWLECSYRFLSCWEYLKNRVESCLCLWGADDRAELGSCDKPGHMTYDLSSANMNPARLWPEQQCSASRGLCWVYSVV